MKTMATPAAKRAAGERKLDIAMITGTGIGGYVQMSDILNFKQPTHNTFAVAGVLGKKPTPLAKSVAAFYGVDLSKVPAVGDKIIKADVLNYQENKQANIIPLTGMRGVIARRMQESMQTAPQYTNHSELCVHELKKFLKEFTEKNLAAGGVKPTLSDLLIKAVAMALHDNMIMNSSFSETYIEIHENINIGLAVALDDGLIVPNIKNADKLTLAEITAERRRLVDKARAVKLFPEEYSGGTFTISNMGQYPVQNFTPIINLPEAAIMGVGCIVDRVVPVDGNIGIRPMMAISLTSDHRHVDGVTAGRFMKRFAEIIENPTCME